MPSLAQIVGTEPVQATFTLHGESVTVSYRADLMTSEWESRLRSAQHDARAACAILSEILAGWDLYREQPGDIGTDPDSLLRLPSSVVGFVSLSIMEHAQAEMMEQGKAFAAGSQPAVSPASTPNGPTLSVPPSPAAPVPTT